jgi:hypothetical protein
MEFWNETLTQKSWNLLLGLEKAEFKFVLIGGWAAYLWTKKHKSKDIDIVLEDIKEIDILKANYDLRKNDNLRKYEIKMEEIDIDIYVPYYSRLAVPAEDIKKYSTLVQGIKVVVPEMLLLLKQGAELDRKDSIKGLKDRVDIMTLLCNCEIDFRKYREILGKYGKKHFMARLKEIINRFKDIKYLDLNPREFKLRKKKIVDALRNA